VRSAAGPVICAAVLVGLLSAWVVSGGAGSISRVRIQVTLAAVPMRGFTSAAADSVTTAKTYLTIENLSGTPDELISVRSPDARRVVLTGDLVIPATALSS
jgi:copper(I)-binding protein